MTTATKSATIRRMYIDGKWCDADDGRTLGVINPATEEVIAEVAYGGRAETRRALEAAARAMPAWMKLTAWDRAKVLQEDRRADARAGRRHRPHADDGTGQAAGRSQGGSAALRRHLRVVRRGRQARLWPGDPQLGPRQTARDDQASGRRRGGHQSVELPDHAASAQDRARPWRPAAPSSASPPARRRCA